MNSLKKHYKHMEQQNDIIKLYILLALLMLMAVVLFIIGCFTVINSRVEPDTSASRPAPRNDTNTSQTAPRNDTKDDNVVIKSDLPIPHIYEEPAADTSGWNLILVNAWNRVPENFTVELSQLHKGQAVDDNQSVDYRIYNDLQAMLHAAHDEELSPVICSSYRTNRKQRELYDNKVESYLAKGYSQKDAEIKAGKWVAVPGTSEHQTGLAIDIVDMNYQILDKKQEKTPVQKWLMENSYKYGFILRYPNNKSDITGINYEPWHYRYVGKEAASEIYEKGICFEEYLEELLR